MVVSSKKTKDAPPGNFKDTVFLMDQEPSAYSFMVEKVDVDLYELSTFILDKNQDRTEYVMHCTGAALKWLVENINSTLKENPASKQKRLK